MAENRIITCSYKRASNLHLLVDIHIPAASASASTAQSPLPVLLWYHGGGLLQDSRTNVAHHLKTGVTQRAFILVSVDYRLAPQIPLDEIVADCTDALAWTHANIHAQLQKTGVEADTQRMAVAGGSAGGFLSLLVALSCPKHIKPALKACLSIYPITDPSGTFFTTSHDLGLPFDEKALAPFIDPQGQVMSGNDAADVRGKMYFYMLKEANLASLLHLKESAGRAGRVFQVDAELTHRPLADALPPVYLVHGDADVAVGVEQSRTVRDVLVARAAAQQSRNLPQDRHRYDEISGADHLFDKNPKEPMTAMYAFLATCWQEEGEADSHSAAIEVAADDRSFTRTSDTTRDEQPVANTLVVASEDEDSGDDSDDDYTDSDSEADSNLQHADAHWRQSMQEVATLANLILLPYLGKYFGRQFAFWSWARWVTWRFPGVHVDVDKATNRMAGAVVAGVASL